MRISKEFKQVNIEGHILSLRFFTCKISKKHRLFVWSHEQNKCIQDIELSKQHFQNTIKNTYDYLNATNQIGVG